MMIGFIVLFFPKGLKLRRVGFIILLTLFTKTNTANITSNDFVIDIMDSGQGLAVVIRTKEHNLLFDTGFSSSSGFNIADSAIIPYLIKSNITKLDKVIISHGDNDHIGGLVHINDKFIINEILTSNISKVTKIINNITTNIRYCNKGQSWNYDGVLFNILHPDKTRAKFKKNHNNSSCVLKISNDKYSVLLTGDIEKYAEKYLVKTASNYIKSNILLVPHHGSNTSSSYNFIKAVAPDIVINSSGYKNRFGHPSNKVKTRYQKLNIPFFDTQCSGQINITLDSRIKIEEYRKISRRYWNRYC